jgi:hypothetical protein
MYMLLFLINFRDGIGQERAAHGLNTLFALFPCVGIAYIM